MMIRIGDLVIMNVYVSEGWKNEIVNTVTRLSRQCVTDGLGIMTMGDFNLIPSEMAKVARKNNLKLCPSPVDGRKSKIRHDGELPSLSQKRLRILVVSRRLSS